MTSIVLDSISTNPDAASIRQSSGSTDWMWAAFAVLMLTDILLVVNSFRALRNRLLHQLAIIIVTTASVAYFSMASNLGHTPIPVEFTGAGDGTRSIYYVRYIMWFINAPLLLLTLYIGTGFPLQGVFSALFLSDVAVVCGLVGALVQTSYKWGYYVIGVFALFYVIGHMFTTPVAWPSPTGRSRGAYNGSAVVLATLALIYPLVWGLCEGGNELSVIAEMIWYGIMDVLIFSFFVAYFLWAHDSVELDGAYPVSARPTKAAEAGAA
ncbi:family A G protein-coupled receptor-like protein [Vararia minispora EC-137]|uniref:Family A G protein-coupled receptor-like protein n=1 Tax=Vararia minispora EC-137 TaxID=1314806 RepID=A0ACB8QJY9_9AGAM|nr:family A G protein-coupled receptor-like protein [Vararia minispora EC-137]